MKLIKASFQIESEINGIEILKQIEKSRENLLQKRR